VTARRVVNARKCVNEREGWTRAEDTLPTRFLTGDGLSRDRLETMIAAYYQARGWTTAGNVPEDVREALGLRELGR
jgi:aldehyde:ferredoxin oxidoreductase